MTRPMMRAANILSAGRPRMAESARSASTRTAASAQPGTWRSKTPVAPLVCYLDRDDEYFPDYLESVMRHRDKGDVLLFGYDFVYEDGAAGSRPLNWDPGRVRQFLFVQPIVTPLGVAHRRELWRKVGGFDELLSRDEDWDFWKRMARGAEFAFLPLQSGRYHVRANQRQSHAPHQPAAAREVPGELAQRAANFWRRSLPSSTLPLPARKAVRKIAFVSPHCLLDFTNGAATATLDGLALLARSGFQCQVFCGSRHRRLGRGPRRRNPRAAKGAIRGPQRPNRRLQGRMIFTTHGQVPVTLFNSASTRGGWIDARRSRPSSRPARYS